MKYQRISVAIVLGILCSLGLRYANDAFMASSPRAWQGVSAVVIASAPLGMLVALLPGFVAGWVSRKRGILAGFVVGFLGSAIYSAATGTARHYFLPAVNVSLGTLIFWFFLMCFVSGVFGAAAGGTAQLVRSNYSVNRTLTR